MNGHRSASGTRARHITSELHQIWMGNNSISDVDREVIGRIARASLRHEEKVPGTVVSRVRLRGGGQGNKRNCGCHAEQRFLHHHISDCADIGVLAAPKDAKGLHGANFRGICISSSCAIAAERFPCGNDVTLPRDAAISVRPGACRHAESRSPKARSGRALEQVAQLRMQALTTCGRKCVELI